MAMGSDISGPHAVSFDLNGINNGGGNVNTTFDTAPGEVAPIGLRSGPEQEHPVRPRL